MNLRSIVLVALALLPFVFAEGLSASPSTGSTAAEPTARLAGFGTPAATWRADGDQAVTVTAWQPSDPIAVCHVSQRPRRWVTAEMPAVPVWERRHDIVF